MLILESVLSFLKQENTMVLVLILSLTIKVVLSVLFFALSVFKIGFTVRKRVKYVVMLLSLDLMNASFYDGVESIKKFCIISFIVTINFCVIMITLRVKEKKLKAKSCDVDRALDLDFMNKKPILEPLILSNGRECSERMCTPELNFSHVKSILDKMEYYPLTQADRRIVKELYSCINLVKNGENVQELKTRINDGLNDLLKIMSKYGV